MEKTMHQFPYKKTANFFEIKKRIFIGFGSWRFFHVWSSRTARFELLFLLIIGCFLPSSCIAAPNSADTSEGLRYEELNAGSGLTAKIDDIVTIQMVGWLDNGGLMGSQFINTYDFGQPISFKLGTDRVMQAWNRSVTGMKVGGKRRVFVPAKLGYGAQGVENLVPPDADLIFEIELLEVKRK